MHNQLGTESQSSKLSVGGNATDAAIPISTTNPTDTGVSGQEEGEEAMSARLIIICLVASCTLVVVLTCAFALCFAMKRRSRERRRRMMGDRSSFHISGSSHRHFLDDGSNQPLKGSRPSNAYLPRASSVSGGSSFDIHEHVRMGLRPAASHTAVDARTGVLTTDLKGKGVDEEDDERDSGTGDSKKSGGGGGQGTDDDYYNGGGGASSSYYPESLANFPRRQGEEEEEVGLMSNVEDQQHDEDEEYPAEFDGAGESRYVYIAIDPYRAHRSEQFIICMHF